MIHLVGCGSLSAFVPPLGLLCSEQEELTGCLLFLGSIVHFSYVQFTCCETPRLWHVPLGIGYRLPLTPHATILSFSGLLLPLWPLVWFFPSRVISY